MRSKKYLYASLLTISCAFSGSLLSSFSLIHISGLKEGEKGPRNPLLAIMVPSKLSLVISSRGVPMIRARATPEPIEAPDI